MNKTVLAIVSHPDDAEFLCAGTLALLSRAGWKIQLTTMTSGDCGSKELSKEEIIAIRRQEATDAARIINAGYESLEFEDMFITYDKPSILRVLLHLRKIKPQIVLTMSPSCYMVDHEITTRTVLRPFDQSW